MEWLDCELGFLFSLNDVYFLRYNEMQLTCTIEWRSRYICKI